MSAIARILNSRGFDISGSDRKGNALMERMREEGIQCFTGHREKNLGGCGTAVYSSSIAKDNIELRAARKEGVKVMHRADMLAKMIKGKKSIAVTGAHGKTTTTALLALIFEEAGLSPAAAVGGEVVNFGSNALCGKGDHFILEADESDGSFLKFDPYKAILLNVDREHFDYFRNIDNVIDAYRRFAENVKSGGTVYYNADDGHLNRLMSGYRGRSVSFGITGSPDVKAAKIKQQGLNMRFRCIVKGKVMPGEVVFPAPGRHNVTNILAAIAVSLEEGISFSKIKTALAGYKGTKRRFEIKNASNGITIIEDYAHHPTEIEAVLRACRPLKKNLIVVFQPHRYTRTRDLFKEFINCFKPADHVILTDIYAASEKAIRGVTAKRLSEEMKRSGLLGVEYMKKNEITQHLKDTAGKDDIVLILGAGDINGITEELSRL